MEEANPAGVGVVGCGFMGLAHIQGYLRNPHARIATICDAVRLPEDGDFTGVEGNVDVGEPVKLDMTQTKATREFKDLLEDPEIDLIDLCVPTFLHRDMAITALEAGKNVICEKPMALTSADARAMVEAAERSHGFLMPAMCIRFWPEWAWLKRAIADNTYGRVHGASFRRLSEAPGWGNFMDGEKSGGGLLDLHIHDSDFVQYCFGRPESVCSQGYTKISGRIDHITTLYQVAGGAAVHAEGGWTMASGFGFNMSYNVNFERATADYDIARGEDALKLFVADKEPETIKCPEGDGYFRELEYVIRCVQEKTAPEIVTAQDGLGSVEICEAEARSVETGSPVTP